MVQGDQSEDVLSVLDEEDGSPRKTGYDGWMSIVENPVTIARYKIMAMEGRLDPGLLKRLLEYKFGRPPEKIELTGKDGGPVSVVRVVLVKPENRE